MKNILLSTLAISLICVGSAQAQSFKRIKKEADFQAQIVGKKVVFEGGYVTVLPNGKLDGALDQAGKFYGVWNWQKGFYCRNLVVNKKERGTDCQRVEISGNKVKFKAEKGKGRVTNGVIQ